MKREIVLARLQYLLPYPAPLLVRFASVQVSLVPRWHVLGPLLAFLHLGLMRYLLMRLLLLLPYFLRGI